jgi:predicted GH43/DUF377 family glycosyl hydrolase
MSDDPPWVRRGSAVLRADPRRVVAKLFLPGQEILARGISRVDAVIQRVLAMSDEEVAATLAATVERFASRHHDLPATFIENFELVVHRLPELAGASADRRNLIGAYCTQEYSVEAAALFNPSIVPHPDQAGLAAGELRFVMSVRAVGEGHISSIGFRTGVLGRSDSVRFDEPGSQLIEGRTLPTTMSRAFLRGALAERADSGTADHVLSLLPAQFMATDLDAALASVERDRLTRGSARAIVEKIRWIASCNYRLQFPADRPLAQRVISPTGPDESKGVEDARFTQFTEDDGKINYFATYTAYDGSHVEPHLLQTHDFDTFDITQLNGSAAKNKGMALFPRRVGGRYLALTRWDRENIGVASSTDTRTWNGAVTVQAPSQPWELIQLGNCGSPLETPEGWLVLTHGVGPMRSYGMGAILLDLDDPTRLIGALRQPMLTPTSDEREGYVPNVVYSCGALLHEGTLVLPYGCSDSEIRMAYIDVPQLLHQLRQA